jgi:hypothetical protein
MALTRGPDPLAGSASSTDLVEEEQVVEEATAAHCSCDGEGDEEEQLDTIRHPGIHLLSART